MLREKLDSPSPPLGYFRKYRNFTDFPAIVHPFAKPINSVWTGVQANCQSPANQVDMYITEKRRVTRGTSGPQKTAVQEMEFVIQTSDSAVRPNSPLLVLLLT
jgi:hypothetical protein